MRLRCAPLLLQDLSEFRLAGAMRLSLRDNLWVWDTATALLAIDPTLSDESSIGD